MAKESQAAKPQTEDTALAAVLESGKPAAEVQPASEFVVKRTKRSDSIVEMTDKGPVTRDVRRVLHSYRVTGVAQSADKLPSRVVKDCVDASEAKQVYFAAFGVSPVKHTVTVEQL